MSETITDKQIADIYKKLQQEICAVLEISDGKGSFEEHPWQKDIGQGVTAVMGNGEVIEKAGVNFSFVSGPFSERMEKILGEKAENYSATGISSIIHPNHPMVPIIHMNVRYFQLDNGVSWFGGGIDLTPHYVDKQQAKFFHAQLKKVCDKYDTSFYPAFKTWADDYFYIPHREETRGIGGIFFDRQRPSENMDVRKWLQFTGELALLYPQVYSYLMDKNRNKPFGGQEKEWQKIRRGRYVEFNLVYDRGTKFGLESGGNTESILISLPAEAAWEYKYSVEEGTKEWDTQQLLKKGINWLG